MLICWLKVIFYKMLKDRRDRTIVLIMVTVSMLDDSLVYKQATKAWVSPIQLGPCLVKKQQTIKLWYKCSYLPWNVSQSLQMCSNYISPEIHLDGFNGWGEDLWLIMGLISLFLGLTFFIIHDTSMFNFPWFKEDGGIAWTFWKI